MSSNDIIIYFDYTFIQHKNLTKSVNQQQVYNVIYFLFIETFKDQIKLSLKLNSFGLIYLCIKHIFYKNSIRLVFII